MKKSSFYHFGTFLRDRSPFYSLRRFGIWLRDTFEVF